MTGPPVCPLCQRPVINPGGHAEACTGPNPNDSPWQPQELDDFPGGGVNVFWPLERLLRWWRGRKERP